MNDVRAELKRLRSEQGFRLADVFAEDRRVADGTFHVYWVFEQLCNERYHLLQT